MESEESKIREIINIKLGYDIKDKMEKLFSLYGSDQSRLDEETKHLLKLDLRQILENEIYKPSLPCYAIITFDNA